MLYHIDDFMKIMDDPALKKKFQRDHARGEPIVLSLEGYDLVEQERISNMIQKALLETNPGLEIIDTRTRQ